MVYGIVLPIQGMFATHADRRPAKRQGSLEETIVAAALADDGKRGWCWDVGVARNQRCGDSLQCPKKMELGRNRDNQKHLRTSTTTIRGDQTCQHLDSITICNDKNWTRDRTFILRAPFQQL